MRDHYDDVIMTMLASQITCLTVVYSIVYSGVNQRKHQSSASLAFVWEIHRGPVNFPHKWPVTRKMFPFDDVIMTSLFYCAPPLYFVYSKADKATSSSTLKVQRLYTIYWIQSVHQSYLSNSNIHELYIAIPVNSMQRSNLLRVMASLVFFICSK